MVKKLLLWLLTFLCAATLSLATDYYVADSDGNDGYDGLFDSFQGGNNGPWKTVAQANSTLTAGDTVYIRTGTYSPGGVTCISPDNSGSDGSPITYENYPGESPNLANWTRGGTFSSDDWIVVKGITMDNGSQSTISERFFELTNSEYITIENCTLKYIATAQEIGIYTDADSHYLTVKGCTIMYIGEPQPPAENDTGNAIWCSSDYALIEENTVEYCGHTGFRLAGDKVVVRNNELIGTWGRVGDSGDHGAGQKQLWENNSFHGIRKLDEGSYSNAAMQISGRGLIVRKNLFYDGEGTACMLWAENGWEMHGLRFYNNVVYDCGRGQYENFDGPFSIHETGATSNMTDCDYRNNIFYNNEADTVSYWVLADAGDHNFTDNTWNATDPRFINPTSDFHLQPESPCRNAGTWLTLTNGTGSESTALIVDDAKFFCDGWGIVEGDYIQLEGQGVTSKITSINYGTNTLTLETALTWGDGVGVTQPYYGSAPDQGAYEEAEKSAIFFGINFGRKIKESELFSFSDPWLLFNSKPMGLIWWEEIKTYLKEKK